MIKYRFEKLVRHKLPERMRSEGVVVHTKDITPKQYQQHLFDKLFEEIEELRQAEGDHKIIEFADVLEVIDAIAKESGISKQDVEEQRVLKRQVNGHFSADAYIKYIEVDEENTKVINYLKDKNRHYKL